VNVFIPHSADQLLPTDMWAMFVGCMRVMTVFVCLLVDVSLPCVGPGGAWHI